MSSKEIDLDAIRARWPEATEDSRGGPGDVRALLAEVERLRDEVEYADAVVLAAVDQRNAARQALADFAADLRALCDAHAAAQAKSVARGQHAVIRTATVRAVIDRHAPATPTTEEDR